MTPTHFFAATDLVVIDRNPEMADYDNPRGDIVGHAAYVYAEDAAGNRRRVWISTARWESESLPRAEKVAAALTARLALGKLPVSFSDWDDARPAYGSDAWQQYGEADEIDLERREAEDEAFY